MPKLLMRFLIAITSLAAIALGGETTREPCLNEDFTTRALDFVQLNAMIDLAMSTGQLSSGLASLDPLSFVNKRLSATNFSFLSMDFTATPIINNVTVKGLSQITPSHLNVTSATGLKIGGSINGTLDVDASVTIEVVQTSHKKWHMCWTDIWHPKDCPPAEIEMTLNISFLNPVIVAETNVAMKRCPAVAVKTPLLADGSSSTSDAVLGTVSAAEETAAPTCSDVTVNDMMTAAITQSFLPFLFRLFRRISKVDVLSASFDFDQMTELSFHFDESSDIRKWIADKLYGWSLKHINERSTMYSSFVKYINKRVKELLGSTINDRLASFFGGNCYDS